MKGYHFNSAGLLIFMLFYSLTVFGRNTNRVVDAKDFFDPSSPTSGIQEAVDHLKPEGGTVFLSPGVYKIRKSVVLFTGIYIAGEGESSVIERIDSCKQSSLSSPGKKGDFEVQVNDASGFFKGGEVTVFSHKFGGFNCTSAMVTEVREKSLRLDKPLRYDYLTESNAGVVNFFPVFTARDSKNIRIENLVIDGKMRSGADLRGDFVYSAIHFVHVDNIFIDKVIIRRFPGDGYSIQGGSNATVTNCVAEHNLGNGFHPGTTVKGSTWTQNTSRYNGGDGLYFCYNVRYATVSDNHFYNNQGHGIGDLGKGGEEGDQMNVVSGNFCYNNGKAGIQCTPGGNNTVINNVCENNSRAEPGEWPGICLKDTHSNIIKGNRCIENIQSVSSAQQDCGILLTGKCEDNMITDNIISGYSKGIAGDNLEMNTIERNIFMKTIPGNQKKQ